MQGGWFPDWWTWTTLSRVADTAGLVALVITVIGFGVTIWNVRKTRSAAERAEAAAHAARSNLLRIDAIASISGVVAALEDVKRLHRSAAWEGMPERYGMQRRLLIAIRAASVDLTGPQRTALQSVIVQLSGIEKQIEEHLAHPEEPPDAAALNNIISKQSDKLTGLLGELKINAGIDNEH